MMKNDVKFHKLAMIEIERFAIHDGPGIRSTVFLQGCPLRCPWCANPESQTIGKKRMYYEKKCTGCTSCVINCPNHALSVQEGKIVCEKQLCTQCGTCEKVCLNHAVSFAGIDMSVEEVKQLVLRDRDYYEESGGGVTISGGECFVQFEGLINLLKTFKKENLHTAVETCGQTKLEYIKEAFPYIDLFLFDLKHMNPEKFHEVTKGNLADILNNIKYIAKQDPDKIVIRVPDIPDFNYDDETIYEILSFAKEQGIKEVHLLPYHTFGINKYHQMGITYPMKTTKSLTNEDLKEYKKIGENMGLSIKIGG